MAIQLAAPGMAERAHRDLYAYWSSRRGPGRLPSRRDIDPGELKRLLPWVSLMDVMTDNRFRVRLAGTGLYAVYGREITGRALDDVYRGAAASFWREQLTSVRDLRTPAAGVHSLAWKGAEHLSLLWQRLPLSSNGRDVDMILGYDALMGTTTSEAQSGIRAA